jgi:hypothetical protein
MGSELVLEPSLALQSLWIGDTTVLNSSADLSWKGFLFERQRAAPENRISETSRCNMVAVVYSPVMRGEHVRGPRTPQSLIRNWNQSVPATYIYVIDFKTQPPTPFTRGMNSKDLYGGAEFVFSRPASQDRAPDRPCSA